MRKNRRSLLLRGVLGSALSAVTLSGRGDNRSIKSSARDVSTADFPSKIAGIPYSAAHIGYVPNPASASQSVTNIEIALNKILYWDRVKLSDLGCVAKKIDQDTSSHNRQIIQQAFSKYSVIEVDGDYYIDQTLWLSYPGYRCKTVALLGDPQKSSLRAYGSWFVGKDNEGSWWNPDGTRWILACLNSEGEFSGGPTGNAFIINGISFWGHPTTRAVFDRANHDLGLRAGGVLLEGVMPFLVNVSTGALRYGALLRNTINARIENMKSGGIGNDKLTGSCNLYPSSAPQWGEGGERYCYANSVGLWLSSSKIRVWKDGEEIRRTQTTYNDNSQIISYNSNTDMIGLLDDGSYSVYTGQIAFCGFRFSKIGIISNTSKIIIGNWFENPDMHAIVYGSIATGQGRSFARLPIKNNHFSYGVNRSERIAILERGGPGAVIQENLLESKKAGNLSVNVVFWQSEKNYSGVGTYFWLNQVKGTDGWSMFTKSEWSQEEGVVIVDDAIPVEIARGAVNFDDGAKASIRLKRALNKSNFDIVVDAKIISSDVRKICAIGWHLIDPTTLELVGQQGAALAEVAYEIRIYQRNNWKFS